MAKILIAEDDDLFRDALRKTLEIDGHKVTAVSGGKAALSTLNTSTAFDLIITDIRMADLDGIALTKAIRSSRNTPIILITGFSEIVETQEAAKVGANEFLLKPFNSLQLRTAIQKVLNPPTSSDTNEKYCRLGIDDFATGRKINSNIFVRLSDNKFTKIAHRGEDISVDRIKAYKQKGLTFLYLRQEDFRKYVGFGLETDADLSPLTTEQLTTKMNLIDQIGQVLNDQIRHDGCDSDAYEAAAAFTEASLDIFTEDGKAVELINDMRRHTDFLFAHSVGVSVFSVMLCQAIDWNLPTNRFKVAIGGMLHDVGFKELKPDLLNRPRSSWSVEEVQSYETHPERGQSILDKMAGIPEDVKHIVKQHHENCLSRGFPQQLKKVAIHPMAKLISVADLFCERVVKNPECENGMSPAEAVASLRKDVYDQLDKKMVEALAAMFRDRVEV